MSLKGIPSSSSFFSPSSSSILSYLLLSLSLEEFSLSEIGQSFSFLCSHLLNSPLIASFLFLFLRHKEEECDVNRGHLFFFFFILETAFLCLFYVTRSRSQSLSLLLSSSFLDLLFRGISSTEFILFFLSRCSSSTRIKLSRRWPGNRWR